MNFQKEKTRKQSILNCIEKNPQHLGKEMGD